jgi:hypothetical protein
MKKIKETITYHEKYKKHSMVVAKDCLPKRLPHVTEGFKIVRIEIFGAGHVKRENEKMEFQDLRVYLKMDKEQK